MLFFTWKALVLLVTCQPLPFVVCHSITCGEVDAGMKLAILGVLSKAALSLSVPSCRMNTARTGSSCSLFFFSFSGFSGLQAMKKLVATMLMKSTKVFIKFFVFIVLCFLLKIPCNHAAHITPHIMSVIAAAIGVFLVLTIKNIVAHQAYS